MKPEQNLIKMRQNLDETQLKPVYDPLSENLFRSLIGKNVTIRVDIVTIKGRLVGIIRGRRGKEHRPTILILSQGGLNTLVRGWEQISFARAD